MYIHRLILLHHAQPNYRITSKNVTKEDWTSAICTIIALHDMISMKEVKDDSNSTSEVAERLLQEMPAVISMANTLLPVSFPFHVTVCTYPASIRM